MPHPPSSGREGQGRAPARGEVEGGEGGRGDMATLARQAGSHGRGHRGAGLQATQTEEGREHTLLGCYGDGLAGCGLTFCWAAGGATADQNWHCLPPGGRGGEGREGGRGRKGEGRGRKEGGGGGRRGWEGVGGTLI